jgi:hypothetical protein
MFCVGKILLDDKEFAGGGDRLKTGEGGAGISRSPCDGFEGMSCESWGKCPSLPWTWDNGQD